MSQHMKNEPAVQWDSDKKMSVNTVVNPGMTFGELFVHYFERHAKTRTRNTRNTHYFFKTHGPRWQNIPVHEITEAEVQEWADRLAATSPSASNRALTMLSAIINWGIKRKLVTVAVNPCKGVERFKLKSRTRFLALDELVRFRDALLREPPIVHDFFWLCLLTGARRGNVMSMQWDEIDFDLETWTIPGEKFKTGETHVLPLSKWALSLLKSRYQKAEGSRWVFPTRRRKNSQTGHIGDPERAWARVLKRAEIDDLHIHDLRRTVGSYMAINGENQYVIAQMLGHKDMRSTAVYARLNLAAVRKASTSVVENWQDILSRGIESGPPVVAQQSTCSEPSRPTMSACDQILIEAKILTAIREGGTTKKSFYRKIGSQVEFDKFDLERILREMEQRQLVTRFQNDAGVIHYVESAVDNLSNENLKPSEV